MKKIKKKLPDNPKKSAKHAGLEYVSDLKPGIHRIRQGKNFKYIDKNGKTIKDPKTLSRIKALAIPPAYKEVWISPIANGHIQATGLDAKGRKQYRYHADWRKVRDETKYHKMIAFAEALPKIRQQVSKDLAREGMPKEKVLAAIVHLLETTLIRVGNEEYARDNNSFGLTTLKNHHVEVKGTKMTFKFRGKSGRHHTISLDDRRLAKIVKKCKDLPGQDLFEYINEENNLVNVSSTDVNEYLRSLSNENFTAKDFRTWAGTILAILALQEFKNFETLSEAKKNMTQALEKVANQLGNTVAICRKCYVHPEIFNAYLNGKLNLNKKLKNKWAHLTHLENRTLSFLKRSLK